MIVIIYYFIIFKNFFGYLQILILFFTLFIYFFFRFFIFFLYREIFFYLFLMLSNHLILDLKLRLYIRNNFSCCLNQFQLFFQEGRKQEPHNFHCIVRLINFYKKYLYCTEIHFIFQKLSIFDQNQKLLYILFFICLNYGYLFIQKK